jgi:hypothetical protein
MWKLYLDSLEPQPGNLFILWAGGAEDRFDISFGVRCNIHQAGIGFVQNLVAGDAGVAKGRCGGKNGCVFGLQIRIEGGECRYCQFCLVRGVQGDTGEQFDQFVEVIQAAFVAHLRGGVLGDRCAGGIGGPFFRFGQFRGGSFPLDLAHQGSGRLVHLDRGVGGFEGIEDPGGQFVKRVKGGVPGGDDFLCNYPNFQWFRVSVFQSTKLQLYDHLMTT